jgi:hypothetical protein
MNKNKILGIPSFDDPIPPSARHLPFQSFLVIPCKFLVIPCPFPRRALSFLCQCNDLWYSCVANLMVVMVTVELFVCVELVCVSTGYMWSSTQRLLMRVFFVKSCCR